MKDDRGQPDTDVIGELIRQAGRRENPSAQEYARVFAAACAALDRKVHTRRRRFAVAGIAATLLVGALAAIVVINWPAPAASPLATLDRVIGPAEVAGIDAPGWRALTREGTVLAEQTRIRTGPGSRLGVLMANGVSLRLAESTEVVFTAPGHVELHAGKVYADAGVSAGDVRRIVIETPAGTTWDIGTQFEVLYAEGLYRLRVREGRVNLQQDTRELQGLAGEQLIVDAERNVQRDSISADDPEWQWTEAVAPNPVIDARSVGSLLEWVSRQTGRNVAFVRPELQLKAETTMLHGSVQFVEPLEALETMLATTDFDYTLLEDGTILIDSTQQ